MHLLLVLERAGMRDAKSITIISLLAVKSKIKVKKLFLIASYILNYRAYLNLFLQFFTAYRTG